MVFGISLSNKRKPSKVPDLSRYDYHYNGASNGRMDEYYRSHDLSADAAFAASVNHDGIRMISGSGAGPSRTASMVGGYSRTNSLRGSYVGRSYSVAGRPPYMRSSSMARRSGSITQPRHRVSAALSSGLSPLAAGGSRQNSLATGTADSMTGGSIIIKTQEVKDMMGRTQSITTQTIRRINGMEYVETTTQTTAPVTADDPQYHFQQFSNDEVPFSSQLTPPLSPDPSKNSNNKFVPETVTDQAAPISRNEPILSDEDGEEFADASEVIESPEDAFSSKVNKINPVSLSSVPASAIAQAEKKLAPKLAPKRQEPDLKPVVRKSTLSQRMTLRDPQVEPVKKKNISAPQNPVQLPPTDKKTLTEEEMYAIALDIAQKKHARQLSHSADNGIHPEMTPIPEDRVEEEPVIPVTQPQAVPVPVVVSEKSRHPKKKSKSLLDRMVQFSQENSGNQPRKSKIKSNTHSSNVQAGIQRSDHSPADERVNTSSSSSLRHTTDHVTPPTNTNHQPVQPVEKPQGKRKVSLLNRLFKTSKNTL